MRVPSQRIDAYSHAFAQGRHPSDTMFAPLDAEERIGGVQERERRLSLPWGGIITALVTSLFLLRFEIGLDKADGSSAAPKASPVTTASLLQQPEALPAPAPVSTPMPEGSIGETPTQPTVVNEEEPPPTPASEAPDTTQPVVPLPPVIADKDDPYQVRALAVGLHPGLSRALLARLTKADFRNAAHAIHTALVRTPAGKTFIWPRGRSKNVVQFRVRFVPSISADCRRYIVEVIKDGWITTAQPMETCGIKTPVAAIARR